MSLKNAVYLSRYIYTCHWVIVSIGTQPMLAKLKAVLIFYAHLSLQNRAFCDDMLWSDMLANRGRTCKSRNLCHSKALKTLYWWTYSHVVSRKLCRGDTFPITQTYFQSICRGDFEMLFELKKPQTWGHRKVGGRRVKMQGSFCLSGELEWGVQTPAHVNMLGTMSPIPFNENREELYSTFTWAPHPTAISVSRRLLPQDPVPLWVASKPSPQGRWPRWAIPRNPGQIIGTPSLCLRH